MKFSAKKILLLGFVIVLLVAIPLTVFLVQQQVKTRTGAVPATNLSLSPQTTTTTIGSDVTLDVNIDPGSNLVSFVKVLISYDATKLATSGAGFVPNISVFPTVLQGPTYGPDTISVTLSVGSSPQAVIQQAAKIGTITFKTIDSTQTAPTRVIFGAQTQVLSTGSSDQFNENVLSTTVPASINIESDAEPSATPTDTPTPTPTLEPVASPTATLTPTIVPGASPTDTPTPTPTLEPGVSPTEALTPTPTQTPNGPTCTSLTLDRSAAGTVPYNVNFTLVGTAGTAILDKATFNFGDGETLDITKDQGVGDNSVNILQTHVYNTAGTFTATATVTDINGVVSTVGSTCTQTLTISAAGASVSPLPPTGPSKIITFGLIGMMLTIIGAVLLFAL